MIAVAIMWSAFLFPYIARFENTVKQTLKNAFLLMIRHLPWALLLLVILVASVLFCTMGYVGYTAYEKMTVSEAEKFMQVNVEALTRGESGGTDYTCESKIGDGDRKTFFCAACDWVKGDPTWDSVTKSCTK